MAIQHCDSSRRSRTSRTTRFPSLHRSDPPSGRAIYCKCFLGCKGPWAWYLGGRSADMGRLLYLCPEGTPYKTELLVSWAENVYMESGVRTGSTDQKAGRHSGGIRAPASVQECHA